MIPCSSRKKLPTNEIYVICIDSGRDKNLKLMNTYRVIGYYRAGNRNILGYHLAEVPGFGFMSGNFIQIQD